MCIRDRFGDGDQVTAGLDPGEQLLEALGRQQVSALPIEEQAAGRQAVEDAGRCV